MLKEGRPDCVSCMKRGVVANNPAAAVCCSDFPPSAHSCIKAHTHTHTHT